MIRTPSDEQVTVGAATSRPRYQDRRVFRLRLSHSSSRFSAEESSALPTIRNSSALSFAFRHRVPVPILRYSSGPDLDFLIDTG